MKAKGWFLESDRLYLQAEPDGFEWFIGSFDGHAIYDPMETETDEVARQKIMDVLNRELPLGKSRKRKASRWKA